MPQPSTKKLLSPDDLAAKVADVLLAEAVSDGPEGLEFVADTMFNRASRRKKPLHYIATESHLNDEGVRVYQFTGAGRKDLARFVSKQPPMLRQLALEIARERLNPQYVPKYPGIENYVTEELYERRHSPKVSSWVREYVPAGKVGSHIALVPPKKGKR